MVAHVPARSSIRPPSHGRPLRLSMVAAGRTRRTQTQDVVCPRPCQWERTDTMPDFGTINPPRAARTPGGLPDGRTVDPSPPAFTWTGPAAGPSVARAPADRQRYPSRYNSRYGARVALARPARGARGSERRQAPGTSSAPGHRRRHQRRADGRTRTRGAALLCAPRSCAFFAVFAVSNNVHIRKHTRKHAFIYANVRAYFAISERNKKV